MLLSLVRASYRSFAKSVTKLKALLIRAELWASYYLIQAQIKFKRALILDPSLSQALKPQARTRPNECGPRLGRR